MHIADCSQIMNPTHLVFIVNPLVEGHEGLIPDVRSRDLKVLIYQVSDIHISTTYLMDHVSTVCKVGVHDVLDKPGLNKFEKVAVEGDSVAAELLRW